jgi:hypothetical protein
MSPFLSSLSYSCAFSFDLGLLDASLTSLLFLHLFVCLCRYHVVIIICPLPPRTLSSSLPLLFHFISPRRTTPTPLDLPTLPLLTLPFSPYLLCVHCALHRILFTTPAHIPFIRSPSSLRILSHYYFGRPSLCSGHVLIRLSSPFRNLQHSFYYSSLSQARIG